MSGSLGIRRSALRILSSRPLWRWGACLAATIAVGAVLSTAAWLALSDGPVRAADAVELLIPSGTAEAVERGAAPPALPANLRFVQGDTLVLRNEDSVEHRVGGYAVAPGTTLRIPLDQASSFSLFCSFHPQGSIGLDVRPHTSPLMILWPTLMIGIPFGLISGGVLEVLSRIDFR